MKRRPEIDKASTAPTVKALNVKNQATKQGVDMSDSKALTVAGTAVRQFNGLYSLNDLHKASGGEAKHEPNQFSRLDQTQALIAEIKSADMRNCIETRRGNNGGTYACKELVIAYAAWISAAFHLKVIRVFLDANQPQAPAIDYTRISPAQKQDLREIVQAIVEAGVQKYGETWARFQRKFRINSYEELPASSYKEARKYLIAKLPMGYAGEVVDETEAEAVPTLRGRRWLVSTDHHGNETVRPIGDNQFVWSYREMARGIATGDLMPSVAELVDLAAACHQRLVGRLGNPAVLLAP